MNSWLPLSLVAEGILNLRTIRSLGFQAANEFCFLYYSNMQLILKRDYKTSVRQAGINGFFQAMSFGFYLIGFGFGYYFIATDGLKFTDMFTCVLCITSGAQSASQSGGWLPDVAKAKVAAAEMFEIIDRIPKIRMSDFKVGYPAVPSRNHQISNEDETKVFRYGVSMNRAKARRAQLARDRDLLAKWKRERKRTEKKKKEKDLQEQKQNRRTTRNIEKRTQVDEDNEDRELAKVVTKEILECIDLPLLFYRESAHLLRSKWLEWGRFSSTQVKNAINIEVEIHFV